MVAGGPETSWHALRSAATATRKVLERRKEPGVDTADNSTISWGSNRQNRPRREAVAWRTLPTVKASRWGERISHASFGREGRPGERGARGNTWSILSFIDSGDPQPLPYWVVRAVGAYPTALAFDAARFR